MRGSKKSGVRETKRNGERERGRETARGRSVCVRFGVVRRVTGEYSFIKLEEEGRVRDRPARRAAVAPDRCVCRVVGSQVFFVSLSRSRQFRRRSRSFLSFPRSLSPARSFVRACVHAYVRPIVRPSIRPSVRPSNVLSFSLYHSVNST